MWKWIIGGILLFIVFLLYRIVTGVRRSLRLGNEQLSKALLELTPDDLPKLVQECQEFFRSALGTNLDPDNWQEAVQAIDQSLKDRDKRQQVMRGLSREDVSYYWVLPIGAFLGQLLEWHANGQWKFKTDEIPFMEISVGDGEMTTWPFDKVQKHLWQGDEGDLVAYVNMSVNAEQMVAHLDPTEESTDGK